MNIIEVMRLPLSVDLSGFVHLLQRLQVPHRVSEEGDAQVLWAPDTLAADVRELYQRYPDGNADIQATEQPVGAGAPANSPAQPSLAEQARACKITTLILLLCFIVAGLTGLGDNFPPSAGSPSSTSVSRATTCTSAHSRKAWTKASGGGWYRPCCCTSACCTWP